MAQYRELQLSDYDDMMRLWLQSEGVRTRDADSREGIEKYLLRNPGMSFVAFDGNQVIGSVMAGHDGRRGFIHHLTVLPKYRKQGIATQLVRLSLAALKDEGVMKSHIHVLMDNHVAKKFWQKLGWIKRTDIDTLSFNNSENKNV